MATFWGGLLQTGGNVAGTVIGALNQGAAIQAEENVAQTNANLALQQSALKYQQQQLTRASSSSTIAILAIVAGAGLIIYVVFLRKK